MSQRLGSFTHDPNEELDYLVDWARQLDAGDTITGTPTWVIAPTGSLELSSDHPATSTSTTTTVWLKKNTGTVGSDYTVEVTLVTVGGRTIQGHLLIRIR